MSQNGDEIRTRRDSEIFSNRDLGSTFFISLSLGPDRLIGRVSVGLSDNLTIEEDGQANAIIDEDLNILIAEIATIDFLQICLLYTSDAADE